MPGQIFVYPTSPTGMLASYTGPRVTSGTTTYYFLQAIYPMGRSAIVGFNTVSLPAMLGPESNSFVQLKWNAMPGALAYDVFKNTTGVTPTGAANNAIAVNVTTNQLVDDGSLPALSYTVASSSTPLLPLMSIQTAADTATLTPAKWMGGMLNVTPTAASSLTLPLGADIVAAIPGAQDTSYFMTVVRNLATASARIITLVGNTGSTLTGLATILPGETRTFVTIVTSASGGTTTTYAINVPAVTQPVMVPQVATDTATLTPAQILNGVLTGTPTGAAAYTLPTAADIIAAIPNCYVGYSFRTVVRNTSTGANTITVGGSTGSTLVGTGTVAQNAAREFLTVVTSMTTTSTYAMPTGAF